MGYFSELDVMIQDRVHYKPELTDENGVVITQEENLNDYLQLRDEVQAHLSNDLEFDQLSPIAQDVLRDWENAMMESTFMEEEEDFNERASNNEERF